MNVTFVVKLFLKKIFLLSILILLLSANRDPNSLLRIRLKAIHFEDQSMISHKTTQKYETTDEESQHLTKLMKNFSNKYNLDLRFNYKKYPRSDFNPKKMLYKLCQEFQGTRKIDSITNTLFLINDDNDENEKKNADMGMEYILYLSAIMKIPVITWLPDRVGEMENSAHSMAIRLEPMNWHVAHAFVDFMKAYNWDLVTLLVSNKQREHQTFLKEFKNIQKERSNIDHINHFQFTISDVHYFQGLDSVELFNCTSLRERCPTIRSLVRAMERILKNNDRIILFFGNKWELTALLASVRSPKGHLKKLFGKGYLWICSPSLMNPIKATERSNSISLDSMIIEDSSSKVDMKVSGMFFFACLNHYSIYKKKAEFVRKLWQKSLIKLIHYFEETFPPNKTDLMNRILPKNICSQNNSVWNWGQRLYQIMKKETIEFNKEYIGFLNNGAINTTELFIFNSKVIQNQMKWYKVGKWFMSSKLDKHKSKITLDGVTWPGGENKPPKGRPDKVKLRVATIQEMPFVFYGRRLENGKCDANAIACRILQKSAENSDENKVYGDDEDDVSYKEAETSMNINSTLYSNKTQYVPSCCAGLTMDLLLELMKDLNFAVDLFEVPDGKWGGWTPDGWNGLVKVLLDGEADLVMTSLKITPNRSEQIDFSVPFMETGIAIIVALRKGAISPTAFLEPYDYPSWCLILVFSVHACGAALFIYEWLSPQGLNRGNASIGDHKFSLVRSLWLIWSMLFGASVNTDNPRGVASRFLANIWALFALVFLASYTANLAAFMIAKDDYYDLEGIKDWRLMNPHTHKPTFRFATVPSGATEENIKINFPKMFTYIQNFNKTTVDDGIKALKIGEIDAFIYDSNVLDYKAAKDKKCKLKTVGNLYAMTGYGVGFPKGSKWKAKINDLILRYQRFGKLQRSKRFWMTGQCKKQRTLDSTNKKLGVTNFISAFILLLAGMLLCSLILLLEHGFYRYLRSKIRKIDRYGCCQLVSISMGQIVSFDQPTEKSNIKTNNNNNNNNNNNSNTMNTSFTTDSCNSSQKNLIYENSVLKEKVQKLEVALNYYKQMDGLKKSSIMSHKNTNLSPHFREETSVSLANLLSLQNRKHQEKESPSKKEISDATSIFYRCENQNNISLYCPKHIALYNQKNPRHHSFYTLPKFSNRETNPQISSSNAESNIQKYPSCNNVSALSNITKPSQDNSGRYRIIKSKLPNNFYRFSNSINGPGSSFTCSILKGKKKKDEMMVKESCL